MNTYLSSLVSQFQAGSLGLSGGSAASNAESGGPDLGFIAAFNPSCASDQDETLETASKQILFFIRAQNGLLHSSESLEHSFDLQEQVHLVGLLRGSRSLVDDFGTDDGPIAVKLSNQTIVVVEVEHNFYVACCLRNLSDEELVCVAQTGVLVQQCHRRFQLFNSSFELLIRLHGKKRFCEILRAHWSDFLCAVNDSALVPFGPNSLRWPTRLNCGGTLLFLSQKGYRKSSLRYSDSCAKEMDAVVRNASPAVSGWTIWNSSKNSAKENGVSHASPEIGTALQRDYVEAIHDYVLFLFFHGCLDPEHMYQRDHLHQYFVEQALQYRELAKSIKSHHSNTDRDDEDHLSGFGVTPAAALELLHPAVLTNNLVVLPLNTTVSQLKILGLAFSDTIAIPAWLTPWKAPSTAASIESTQSAVTSESMRGAYLTGLVCNTTQNFLVNLPTCTGAGVEWREYLLVVYQYNNSVITLIYESGLPELASSDFYVDLEKKLFMPLLRLMHEGDSWGTELSAIIGSLPGPIGEILSEDRLNAAAMKKPESQIKAAELDSDFFYIIYDTKKKWYRTSLPDLAADSGSPIEQRAVFHLHHQLAGQFFVRGRSKTFFSSTTSDEHLYKFASSKSNDWLFYGMKYSEKIIVIIRNYNHRAKPKVPELANRYLSQMADSVYGASNLGFLDSLGSDVKGWLGRLGAQED